MKEYQQEHLKGKFIVEWQAARPITDPKFRYNGFQPGSTVLPKGWLKEEGMRPLPCDIRFDRDVAITLRDGTVVYACLLYTSTGQKVMADMTQAYDDIDAVICINDTVALGACISLEEAGYTLGEDVKVYACLLYTSRCV